MLLGFKKQFVPKIEGGSKIHTFRGKRKIQPKIGETLYCYTGLRTSFCKKILGDYSLQSIQSVRMTIKLYPIGFEINLKIGNKDKWSTNELNEMAVNDGFDDIQSFIHYWTDGCKNKRIAFLGQCFHWTNFKY